MTESTEKSESQQGEPKAGFLKRFDRHVYGFETGVVTGALLVMTFTYVFMIIHRQMSGDTVVDEILLRMLGPENGEAVSDERREFIVDVLSPIVLSVLSWLLALLALRTRWRSGERVDDRPEPWARFAVQAVVITVVLYVLMKLVGTLPSEFVCLFTRDALMIGGVAYAWRKGEWGLLAGFVFASVFVGVFFIIEVEEGYSWAGHFSLVLLFYVGFLGASMATRDGRHVTIDAVRKKIPRRYLYLYNSVGNLVTIVMTVFLLVLAYEHMRIPLTEYVEYKAGDGTKGYGHYIEGTELPVFMVTVPIFIAFLAMVLRFSARLIHDLRAWSRGELPPEPEVELH